ncbi:MAG TPA: hypothetical protein VFJ52_08235 [Terriglobia bacterium]|nr:hypothetical protein [Terriglobia bacterium]
MRRLLGPVRFCSYLALAGVLCRAPLKGATQSILFARGYTVIPLPQKIAFRGGDFEIGDGWRLELGKGVKSGDVVKFSQELAARNEYAAAHGLAARTGKFDWTDYEH